MKNSLKKERKMENNDYLENLVGTDIHLLIDLDIRHKNGHIS